MQVVTSGFLVVKHCILKILRSCIDQMFRKGVPCSMRRLKCEVVVRDQCVFSQVMPPKNCVFIKVATDVYINISLIN